jgi:tetratricopeptide (TPR) repeat protein
MSGHDASGDIHKKSVTELVRAVRNAPDGEFTFLIGAGASAPQPAEIPTAEQMIEQFQQEIYNEEDRDIGDIETWAADYEPEGLDESKRYGYWFSKAYPTAGGRREAIQDFVTKEKQDETVDPPFGQIILASMMDDGIISHTFTPNFDDLLFDAFYDFSENRPLFIDHNAKARRFNMSGNDPAIVKLHGDYLHYTQNTPRETAELKTEIKNSFRQSVTEYGTIVVGYGGNDESIMNVLENATFSERGLFWCKWTDSDDLDERVKELLRDSEYAYLVEIDGADEVLGKFLKHIDRVDLPDPQRIEARAEEKREMIEKRKDESLSQSADTDQNNGSGSVNESVSRLWDARNKMAEGEYEEAIAIVDSLIESEPENSRYYNHRGIINRMADNNKQAIEDYDRAVDLDPDAAFYYYNRGNAKRELERYEEAIEDYNRAIELNPEDADNYVNRGNTKIKLERYEEAIEDYNRAIELDPDEGEYYSRRGYVKLELERYQEALEDYNRAIELDPDKAEYYVNRGTAKLRLEDYEEAIEDYSQGIEIDPNSQEYYTNRGSAKHGLKRFQQAEKDYKRAINMGGEDLSTLLNLAELYVHTGKPGEAQDIAKEARSLGETPNEEAKSLLLQLIADYLVNDDVGDIESEYRSVCAKEFTTEWNFSQMDMWLADNDLADDKIEQIEEWVNLLRKHR